MLYCNVLINTQLCQRENGGSIYEFHLSLIQNETLEEVLLRGRYT